MRALLLLFALAGCDVNLFDKGQAPEGLICGDGDSCPPGQECATAEHRCRVRCGTGGSCDVHTDIEAMYQCDRDGYCRRRCMPMNDPGDCDLMHSDAQCTWSNDNQYPANRCGSDGFCRPLCPCDRGFVCVEVSTQVCSIGLCYPPNEVPDGSTVVDGFTSDANGNQPGVTQVGSSGIGSTVLRIDNTALYWSSGSGVFGCALSDCSSPSHIGDAGATVLDLIVTGGLVVFSDTSGNINYCPKDLTGGQPTKPLASGQSHAAFLASDGINAYWTTDKPNLAVMKVGLAGGSPQTLAQFSGMTGGGIAVDGSNVYWASGQTIFSCDTTVCPSPMPAANVIQNVGLVAIDAARNAFFVDGDCIEACQLPRCTPTRLACNGGPTNLVPQIASDGTGNLYWTMLPAAGAKMGEVRRCSATGCNNMPTSLAMMQNAPYGIAVDNMWVYWIDSGDGTIRSRLK